jgi:cytochrome c oxidase subunit 1
MTRRDDLSNGGRLEETWADPTGFYGWFTHVDHKSIGRRYLVTAFAFFLLGGVLAALMRLQLSRPDNAILAPISTTRSSPPTAPR